jgi:tetratricopeptide (TPR) repeat protein
VIKNIFRIPQKQPAKQDKRNIENFLIDAIEAFENGNLPDAVERFNLIIKAYPDHPLAHLMVARCYIEGKKFEKAIDALYGHLKVVPNSVEAMVYLGLAYYECGELALAQSRFEEAMKLKQNSTLARENLVITKISAGHLDEALNELIALHDEQPQDQNVVELLVLTLGRLGKWEAAKQYIHHMGKAQPATGAV